MKKRLLAGILAAMLLVLWMPVAHAEETAAGEPSPETAQATEAAPEATEAAETVPLVHLSVATVAAENGEAQVALTIENGNSVDSLQCNLNYDAAAMTVTRITPGVTFPAEYCITNKNEAGRVRLAAACALGLDNENGMVILLDCKLKGAAGSAITISDAIVTTVGAEYVQSKAYITIADGGITVGGALPRSVATPWIPETPVPPATPTPEPTEAPTPAVIETPIPAETPSPEPEAQQPQSKAMLPYIIAGVLAVLLAAGIIILLVSSSNQKKRRKKKRAKSSK